MPTYLSHKPISLSNAAESFVSFHAMVLARRYQRRARELRQDPWSAGGGSAPLSASEHEEMRSHLWGHQAQLRSRQQAPPSRGHGAAAAAAAPSEADALLAALLASYPQLGPEVVLGVAQSVPADQARALLDEIAAGAAGAAGTQAGTGHGARLPSAEEEEQVAVAETHGAGAAARGEEEARQLFAALEASRHEAQAEADALLHEAEADAAADA